MSFLLSSQRTRKKQGDNTNNNVDINVDNKTLFVDKWKTRKNYTHTLCFIPSTTSRRRSLVDNSCVMVSTPCMMVV